VIKPDELWERSYYKGGVQGRRIYIYGTAFYDPIEKQYRMWYMSRMENAHKYTIPGLIFPGQGNAEHQDLTLYATSEDGCVWHKPNLGLFKFMGGPDDPRNNNIMTDIHGPSVLLDMEEPDPKKRYKMIGFQERRMPGKKRPGINLYYSPDGIDWTPHENNPVIIRDNEGTFNIACVPSLGCYIAASIEGYKGKRSAGILLSDGRDMNKSWTHTYNCAPDDKDTAGTCFYGMTPFVRGDLILGFLQVFDVIGRGPAGIDDGHIESQLVYSRDGRKWRRFEDRTPIIPIGPGGSYDGGMIMMAGNGPLVNGDKMTVYYTAANTTHGDLIPNKYFSIARIDWPLDRLASLTAGETEAVVETVVLNAPAGKLMLNADAKGGYIVVEVLDAKGRVLKGFSGKGCVPIAGDSLEHCVKWENGDLAKVKQPIRLRFRMKKAKLFSIRFD
jgi:hypothetical protein